MPEMKTMRPRASMALAWEKWPLGLPMRSETICWRGMAGSFGAATDEATVGLCGQAKRDK
jgi:hypothetical protein